MTTTHDTTMHRIPAMKLRMLAIAALLILVAGALPRIALAQSSDALTSVDQTMRYMKSANYSEDDLKRRLAWGDKLVNDIVSYKPGEDDRQNYVMLLDIAINHYKDENQRLKVLLRAVTTLDPLVQKYFPQWLVQDEAMILEMMRKMRDNRDDLTDAQAIEMAERVMTGKARMRVVQSPKDPENLIGIIIEKARPTDPDNPEAAGFITNTDNPDFEDYRVVGRKNLKDVLTQDLYDRVVDRRLYAHIDETGAIKPQPYVAEAWIDVPFGGGFLWTLESDERKGESVSVQVSRIRAGFELKIGNDWVNLPFMYAPQWNALFVYESSRNQVLKLGPSIPFTWGDKSVVNTMTPRKLNGTLGVAGEYFTQLSNIAGAPGTDADGLGAAAFVSAGMKTFGQKKITDTEGNIINGDGAIMEGTPPDQTPSLAKFYYISATATAYYWRDLGFMLDGLRGSLGFGYMKVNECQRMGPPTGGQTWEVYDTVKVLHSDGMLDAYAKLAYDHRGKATYGLSLQYFNGGLMGEAYLNIFSWMRAEVKYSRVVFRDPKPWEVKEIIVPGLRFGFAF